MKPTPFRGITTAAAPISLMCVTLLLAGCISYKSESGTVHQSIPDERYLNTFEPGATTTEWLLAKFGQPEAVRNSSDTLSVWQYENIVRNQRVIKALPLLAIELKKERTTVYHFEVENDVVLRFWKETPSG